MELTTSSALGAARLSIQIISSARRPVLEIYEEVRNEFGPQVKIPHIHGGETVREDEARPQTVEISIRIANIGTVRAEDVSIEFCGTFLREPPRDKWPEGAAASIKQFPPGHVRYLATIEEHDLFDSEPTEWRDGKPTVYERSGFKKGALEIVVLYNAPHSLLNSIRRLWTRRIKRKTHDFETRYFFEPSCFEGDLPPPSYVG